MSTDVADSNPGTSSERPPNRFVGLSPHRLQRQAFPKTLSDKYRLGEELGRGAYGHVFRGLDTRTGQHVAIKQIGLERIPAGGLPGIVREVELLKTLNHPNIVKYYGSLRTDTHLYIVLEYMENGALSGVIKSSSFGPFPETLVAVYVQQVLQGLAYLHAQGVVHRDIKGANILTTKEGVVKLADFGVAAQLSDLDTRASGGGGALAGPGPAASSPVGTVYWMAPEVIEHSAVAPAGDIWSVGCLAIELFTGSPPYYDMQPMSALYNIVADTHPPLPRDISASMRDFLLKCFARDPRERPSAAALAEHPWVTYNRRTLRGTWSRTRGGRAGGRAGDAHTSVALVVERMLAVDEGGDGDGRGAGATEAGAPAAGGHPPPPPSPAAAQQAQAQRAQQAAGPGGSPEPPGTDDLTGAGLLARLQARRESSAGAGVSGKDGPGVAPPPPAGSETAASVRRQLASLDLGPPAAPRNQVKEAAAAASCAALAGLLRGGEAAEAARALLAGQGLSALRELLGSPSERLLDRALDATLFALSGTAGRACLAPAMALGFAPALLRFAAPSHSHILRVQAARAAEILCASSIGARAVLSSDALPAMLDLLLPPERGDASPALCVELMQPALNACWLLLHRSAAAAEEPSAARQPAEGLPPLDALLRALAAAALPQRMTAVLRTVLSAYCLKAGLNGPVGRGPGNHSRSASVPLTETELAQLAEEKPTSSGETTPPHTPSRTNSPRGQGPSLTATLGSPRRGPSPTSAQQTVSRLASSVSMRSEDGLTAGAPPPRSPVKRAGRADAPAPPPPAPSPLPLLDAILNMYAAMVLGDGVVKAALVQRTVLAPLFEVTAFLPPPLALTVVSAVRALTVDPTTLGPLADASGVAFLVAQLARAGEPLLQDQALSALHRMAAADRARQEQAAVAGAVPFLCQLGILPQRGAVAAHAHGLAVSLLCALARGGARVRAELWAHDALSVFLHLLKDEACQVEVLDALAAWLAADAPRIEARLAAGDAQTRLVTLVPVMSTAGEGDALCALLVPLQRLLSLSPRMARELAQNGLVPRVTELLRRPTSPTTLPALDVLATLVAAAAQPRALAARFRLAQVLVPLAGQAGMQPGVAEKVAQLLQAIRG
ncbi:hypothetical protein ACKKBF_B30420 [Auxenochlorella protothecoides x Auxenochlorella symbiontica]